MITKKQWNEFVEAIRYHFFRGTEVSIYNEPVIQVDTENGIVYVKSGDSRKRYSFEESVYENTSFMNLCDSVRLKNKLVISQSPKEKTVTKDDLEPGYWYVFWPEVNSYYIVHILRNQLSEEGEWMVWVTDREGAIDIDEIGIENFIRKVPEP